jgi:hypothetical protein
MKEFFYDFYHLVTSTANNGTKRGRDKVTGNGMEACRYFCDLKIVTHPVAGNL